MLHKKTAAERMKKRAEKVARAHFKAQKAQIRKAKRADARAVREYRQRVRRERLERKLNKR